MRKKHHSHKNSLYGKDLVILPIVFCVIIYIICTVVAIASVGSYMPTIKMFFSDSGKDMSENYVNIFVPVDEPSETEASGSPSSPSAPSAEKKETVSISSFTYPSYDNQFGELTIEDCQVNAKLFFGDSSMALRNGVGVYYGSSIPGYGKTILVAGHNNTYFNGLKYAKKGQIIKIRTNYGNYRYEITDTQIKDKNDRSAYDLSADHENLILYTCYPFDELGLTPNRFFVYAKFVSGPVIDKKS